MSAEEELVEAAGRFFDDPLGFVLYAYPWGEPGPLLSHPGPDTWQRELLVGIGEEIKARTGNPPFLPIRRAVSSGHGIGKSTIVAWLVDWIMVTRPATRGTITANTFSQLETKTWASIQHWTKLCIFRHWFGINAGSFFELEHKEDWNCAPASSKEENSEAFAGQHSEMGSSVYFFDEDSAIPDKIHEVAEGGLTDGEPMIFLFGNATRNSGHFHQACFGTGRDKWHPIIVDSRTSRFTNKTLIAEWEKEYGEDSDFFRVRVRGLPPRASELQFIDQGRVAEAQKRALPVVLPDEPLIAGVDVSDGGAAWNVVRFRRGADARSIPPIRIPGEKVRGDRGPFLAKLAEVLTQDYGGQKVAMMFVDSAFGAPYVERLQTMGFQNVTEVRFGSESLDFHQANRRAYIYQKMKDWLMTGAIDPKDQRLETDLTAPGYHINKQDKLVIESKEDMQKRGVDSPDDADALCFEGLTAIRTPTGLRALCGIRPGDVVSTPFGPSEVMRVHRSVTDRLTEVLFSGGKTLCGKPSHDVFTFSRGVQRLDALRLTDEVEVYTPWRSMLWRLVSMSFTKAGSIGFKAQANTFNPGSRLTRSGFFIAGCGRMLMDPLWRALRYITRTTIGATISSETWNSYPQASTSASTCFEGSAPPIVWNRISDTWRERESKRLSGMGLTAGEYGIGNTPDNSGWGEIQFRQSASVAESDSGRSSQAGSSIARRLVVRPFNSERTLLILGHVRAAVTRLWLTVIGRRPVVPVFVQTVTVQPTEVFNLTLREHNAYYANDVLVFNCLTFAAPVVPSHRSRRQVGSVSKEFSWS